MDTQNQNQQVKICAKHKQPAILLDIQYQPLCIICVQEKTEIAQIDQVQQKLQEIKIKSDKLFSEEQEQLKILYDSMLKYKQIIINEIDKIIQIITDQMEKSKLHKEKFQQQITSCNQIDSLEQLNNELYNQQYHKQVEQQIKQQLLNFQKNYINLDQFNQINESSQKTEVQQVDSTTQEGQQKKILNGERYQYELIQGSKKRTPDIFITLILIRMEILQLLHVGLKQQFTNLQMERSEISYILKKITRIGSKCLYFMKKSNCEVTGSLDRTIIIRKFDNYYSQCVSQILEDHKDYVNCILFNTNEDLMISGSDDKTIKFWKEKNAKWGCYQTLKLEHNIWAISLNETENKLVIVYKLNVFILLKYLTIINGIQYKRFMQMNVEEDQVLQFRINLFTNLKLMIIYRYMTTIRVLMNIKNIQQLKLKIVIKYINNFLPNMQSHQGQYWLNMIKNDRSYELIQSIKFEHFHLFGRVSNDGQYLITWDFGSQKIQVRRLKLINQ